VTTQRPVLLSQRHSGGVYSCKVMSLDAEVGGMET
jgi:hypothetical protein